MEEIVKLEVEVIGTSCIFVSKNHSGVIVNKYHARVHDECIKYIAFVSNQASSKTKFLISGADTEIKSDEIDSYFKSIYEKQCA